MKTLLNLDANDIRTAIQRYIKEETGMDVDQGDLDIEQELNVEIDSASAGTTAPVEKEKTKRTRRTKQQIAEDKAKEEAVRLKEEAEGDPEPLPEVTETVEDKPAGDSPIDKLLSKDAPDDTASDVPFEKEDDKEAEAQADADLDRKAVAETKSLFS